MQGSSIVRFASYVLEYVTKYGIDAPNPARKTFANASPRHFFDKDL